ncbi:hypothetical protein BATDEDRAFT_35365 [Batrachochytrium dendrobatidis JAM81]|uniref:Tail specific protease domain-containing protein n=1 Tax=Batrachochytrium dendrobatidis (strain JAM81 / FGSC 10211) TaxID=684364 RepID=F4P5G8_BATDJ|nr:uncharacterized protein BATDEDRAFT_35365 [Batrachochytrium dendrobatidis JAM81]EGF79413.1 hypothetical protein BATDEDRAFT_35365 [Batrachochytrium dendrobatidis JAM81]|eukprot:XP_006679979.1 hypothetical protein BATDEDRAFT_35365 [Batrachochytrium dendrobatidis JAM81]
MKFSLLAIASAAFVVNAQGNKSESMPTLAFIKEHRDAGRFVFMPYTDEQRNVVLTNVENGLKLWSNYESKIKNYGERADPFPIIKKLRAKLDASNLTDTEMQIELLSAFTRMRDHHTHFEPSGPYACFFATTGLSFKFIEGDADMVKKPTVVFERFTKNQDLRAFFGKEYDQIKVGDELLLVDGMPFADYRNLNQDKTGGANDYGGQHGALDYMTYRPGVYTPLPETDTIKYQLKSKDTGKVYDIEAPWVVGFESSCWSITSQLYAKISGKTLPGTPQPTNSSSIIDAGVDVSDTGAKPQLETQKEVKTPSMVSQYHYKKQKIDQILLEQPSKNNDLEYQNASVSTISWTIWKPESKNLGIIKLEDFSPTNLKTGALADVEAVREIHKLLSTVLKDTNAVVFDIRANGGGSGEFANAILQLFKPDFQPMPMRYLMNSVAYNTLVNGTYFFDTSNPAWYKTPPGSKYSIDHDRTSYNQSNLYGQAYLKPVGAFTNAMCYSACEVFSAALQSFEIGYVFGEDGTTGGGGADMFGLDSELLVFNHVDFKPMPYYKELFDETAGQSYANVLTIGVRQLVRNGKHQGQLIEDTGVVSDYIVRPRLTDLLSGSTENSQFDRIADQLKTLGVRTGLNNLYFVSELTNYNTTSSDVTIDVEVQGINQLSVIDDTGKSLSVADFKSDIKSQHSFKLASVINDLGNTRVSIIGQNNGKQVLKTHKHISRIPKQQDHFKLERGIKWEFNGTSKSVGIYNSPFTKKSQGWNSVNGKWVIGDGIQYSPAIETDIRSYYTAPVGSNITVEIDARLESQFYSDFLGLYVTDADGNVESLLNMLGPEGNIITNSISGSEALVKKFPVTTKTEQFFVNLMFKSDVATQMKGATINSWSVTMS